MHKMIITFFTALATIFAPAIVVSWLLSLSIRTHYGGIVVISPKRLLFAVLVPTMFSIREFGKKSLSSSGIAAAFVVGFVTTIANMSFISSLLVFFVTSSKLTRFRSNRKEKQDEESRIGATRNWLNVLNSGGVPTALSLLYIIEIGCIDTIIDFENPLLYISSWLSISVLGAVACACGDTWASEIGSAIGNGKAKLVTTWKTVPAGTNGGVSIVGTVASILGGTVVGLTFSITNYLTTDAASLLQWPLIVIGAVSGFSGSFLDSFLGATVQYSGFDEEMKRVVSKPGPGVKHICGVDLLSNHAVNFVSCFVTSLGAPLLFQFVYNLLI